MNATPHPGNTHQTRRSRRGGDVDLSARYLQAVTRTIPEAQRADVAAELGASIADQLEARVAGGEEPLAAERAVLNALGDPDALAAGYVDRPLHLIGPRYYLEWWRLLKLLLWIVLPLAALGISLGQALSGAPLGTIIGTSFSGTLTVAVHLAFWTALVFAVIERTDRVRAGAPTSFRQWSVDDLPEPRQSGASFGDLVASLVFFVVAAAVIVWDQLVGAVYLNGTWISFLSQDLWPWAIGGLLAVFVIDAVVQIVRYLHGRWTWPLASINAALNLIVVVPAIWLLSQGRLLNPEFWLTVIDDDGEKVFGILSVLTGFGIVAIAAWDAVDAFVKARRSS
jgi:hypothetical protein